VSIGYPGPVIGNRLIAEPHNLGQGWMGYDFNAAFKRPVKIVNDAAMQALGACLRNYRFKTNPCSEGQRRDNLAE
jgi:predicted NBD/HSP70 family sugar kinase